MQGIWKDLHHSLRSLKRRPAFATLVVVTLALGIGANSAVFSVVRGVLLEPLPFPEPDRLVRLWSTFPERGIELGTVSPADLEDWRRQSHLFEQLGGFPNLRLRGLVRISDQGPEELSTAFVTEGFFETLGARPVTGRTLQPADQEEGSNRVVVLSYGLWQRLFAGDLQAPGKTLELSGERFTVVGVMPHDMELPDRETQIWAPISLIPEDGVPRMRQVRWLGVLGRLRPGVSLEEAESEMTTIAQRLAQEYPESNRGLDAVTLLPLHEHLVRGSRTALLTVLAAVGLVLLITCVNIANVLLVRGEERSREIGIRGALGAPRGRIVRQLLAESLLLSTAGGALGLLLASWGIDLLVAWAPPEIPRLEAVHMEPSVLVFTAAVAMLTGVLFGLVPALQASTSMLHLPTGGRTAGGGPRAEGWRAALVVAEVALVVALVSAAGLLVRSYSQLLRVDPGFEPEHLLTLRVASSADDLGTFFEQLVRRVEVLPGVESAAVVRPLPLRGDTFQGESFSFTRSDLPLPPSGQEPSGALRFVSPGTFRTLGIPLLAGRDFTDDDGPDKPLVLIVSRAAAEAFWPGEDPVGHTIRIGQAEATIVGLVGDIQQTSLAEMPQPALYTAHAQTPRSAMTLVVRSATEPTRLLEGVREAVWSLEPAQPIQDEAAMTTVLSTSLARPRFSMSLLATFALLALLLAAVGIYGVLSYGVAQRAREIGIRMALGARSWEILRQVTASSLRQVALGLALGLGLSALGGQLLESLLFRISPLDLRTHLLAAALLATVTVAASLGPALRSTRVDPTVALRED